MGWQPAELSDHTKGLLMRNAIVLVSLLAAAPAFADETDSFSFLNGSFAVVNKTAQAAADFPRSNAEPRLTEAGDPVVVPPSRKTRAQVIVETRAATHPGQWRYGEAGPSEPGIANDAPVLSRAQVVAETREARLLGLLHYGEAEPREATPEENAKIRAAGARAIDRISAVK